MKKYDPEAGVLRLPGAVRGAHDGAREPGLHHLPRPVAGSDRWQIRRQSQGAGGPCGVREHSERGAEPGSVPGGHL